MSDVQLTGSLTIDSLDCAEYVSKMTIRRTRSAVTVPATLGNIIEHEKAGTLKEVLELEFFSAMTAGLLWAKLYTALGTNSAEVAFTGRLNDGAQGPNNPTFSGSIVILGLDTGADVGALRQQTQTYPITAAGVTKVATA